jgi:isopentenyl-diphosphate delta-isomerase
MRDEVVSFDNELLITVDVHDEVTGFLSKEQCHQRPGVLHRAFSVFLFNAQGEVLLQKRSAHKKLWPGYWANSCCSHPRKGESLLDAAHRRTQEELGVSSVLTHLFTFTYQAHYLDVGSEYEMCSVFVGKTDAQPCVNVSEIEDWKWLTLRELEHGLQTKPEKYTPWLHLEWPRLTGFFGKNSLQ